MSGILQSIGRYQVHSVLGQGNMGTVYRAIDPNLKRTVAIKMIHARARTSGDDSFAFRDRFQREAQAISQLNHPNIIAIYDSGFHQSEPFIVMEFVEGMPLDQAIKQNYIRDIDHKLMVLRHIATGLDYAHSRDIIHRDIKPANILVTPEGTTKLVDFGLAKLADSKLTTTGEFLGTPSYAAPEQVVSGTVNTQTDLFSFAVLSYEMLCGHRPFPGDNINSILYHLVNSPPEFDFSRIQCEAPDAVRAVFDKALAKDPNLRYESAHQFVSDLELSLAHRRAAEATMALNQVVNVNTRPSKRGWLGIATLVTLLAICAVVLGLWRTGVITDLIAPQTTLEPITEAAPQVKDTELHDVGDPEIVDLENLETETDELDDEPEPDAEQMRLAEEQRHRLLQAQMVTELQQRFFNQVDARQLDEAELTLLKLESLGHDIQTERRILAKVTQPKLAPVKETKQPKTTVTFEDLQRRFTDHEAGGQIEDMERVLAQLHLAFPKDPRSSDMETRLNAMKRARTEKIVQARESFSYGISVRDLIQAREQFGNLIELDAATEDDRKAVDILEQDTYINSLNMRFLRISAGTFNMGNQTPVLGNDDNLHEVVISRDFMIAVHEVTQAQWQAVMGQNPSEFKGDHLPVHNVSWKDCQRFVSRLNELEGGTFYRLPTEAEWEYACRAGTASLYAPGDNLDPAQANFNSTRANRGKPLPVGSFKPNAWGLFDMHGNLWEWCEDIYAPYPSEKVVDPVVTKSLSPSPRVIRGGSYASDSGKCESGFRGVHLRARNNNKIGLRLVREIQR